jgi:hypothetical protein
MHTLLTASRKVRALRTAMLLTAATLWIAAPLHTASASNSLSTSSLTSSTTSLISKITRRLSKSIFALPYELIRGAKSSLSFTSQKATSIVK